MKYLRLFGVLATVVAAVLVPNAAAVAAPSTTYGVGISAATPIPVTRNANGPIYVATRANGGNDDGTKRIYCLTKAPIYNYACNWPDASHPFEKIQTAITLAKPGDVIVVRGGSYFEDLGYKAAPGTSTDHINMWAYPGETVYMRGHLNLTNANYWTVRGFRFLAVKGNKQTTVTFFGGTGWSFLNNSVAGSEGYSNLMVRPVSSSSGWPTGFEIGGNCIHDALGQFGHDQAHNMYLQAGIGSSGLIDHNLVFGALNGSNIKVGPGALGDNASPYNLTITRNTMLVSATGIVFGRKATNDNASYNIVGMGRNQDAYDGGVKLYSLVNSSSDSFTNGIIRDYNSGFRTTSNSASGFRLSGIVKPAPSLAYTGSLTSCTMRFTDPTTTQYGHRS